MLGDRAKPGHGEIGRSLPLKLLGFFDRRRCSCIFHRCSGEK
jgi:hypothetical protein